MVRWRSKIHKYCEVSEMRALTFSMGSICSNNTTSFLRPSTAKGASMHTEFGTIVRMDTNRMTQNASG